MERQETEQQKGRNKVRGNERQKEKGQRGEGTRERSVTKQLKKKRMKPKLKLCEEMYIKKDYFYKNILFYSFNSWKFSIHPLTMLHLYLSII